jgi:hypothetical protein
MNIKERLAIARAMIKHGKTALIKTIGEKLLYGDSTYAERIKTTFQNEWSEYQKLSLKDRGVMI